MTSLSSTLSSHGVSNPRLRCSAYSLSYVINLFRAPDRSFDHFTCAGYDFRVEINRLLFFFLGMGVGLFEVVDNFLKFCECE